MRKRAILFSGVKMLFILASIAGFLWLGGFAWFLAGLETRPTRPSEPTDGIVVLTGGPYRISLAVSLLDEGLAERLLISGIYAELEDETLRRANAIPRHIFTCCIDLDRAARNTEENAREVAAWARQHSYRSLRVVTTFDHMPRSMVELRRALPDAELLPHPVSPDTVGADLAWPSVGKLALEYSKYWVALVRARYLSEILHELPSLRRLEQASHHVS